MKRSVFSAAVTALSMLAASTAWGGEQGHYIPSVMGTRDFFLPTTPGFYFAEYDFGYRSGEFFDGSGNRVDGLSLSRSLDLSKSVSGSQSFGLSLSHSSSAGQIISFPGNQLNLGLQLDTLTNVNANLSLSAAAQARLQATAIVNARLTDLNFQLDGFAPTLVWASTDKVLGARFGALVNVPMVYLSIDAKVQGTASFFAQVNGQVTATATANVTATSTATGSVSLSGPRGSVVGTSASKSFSVSGSGSVTTTVPFNASVSLKKNFTLELKDSTFDLGDMYFQPLWLDWAGTHYDIALADGVYAPTGRYTSGAVDNTGLGFWTNQTQLAAAYYPFANHATALTVAGTYEVHSTERGTDIQPGNNFTLNWGLSQFLPLNKAQTWLADVGVIGYDTWQVTDDSGSGVDYDASVHDRVHAWGFQLGLVQVKWNAVLTARWLHEYGAVDRFEGNTLALNLAVKL